MEAVEEEVVRIYTPPTHSPKERRVLATALLTCAFCKLKLGDEAVACKRCELKRYCNKNHRKLDKEHAAKCVDCPEPFKGMVAKTASLLSALSAELARSNEMERVDDQKRLSEDDIGNVDADLLASFYDVAYFNCFAVPLEHADIVHTPHTLAKIGPPFLDALLKCLSLRKAVHLVLDTERTDSERLAESELEAKDPVAFNLRHCTSLYIMIIYDMIMTLPMQHFPNDPTERRRLKKTMIMTVRRFVVALENLKTNEQLDDIISFMADLAEKYGDLFAPWKRDAMGRNPTKLPAVEVVEVTSDDEPELDEIFSDAETSSGDEDGDHFINAREKFDAHMGRRLEGLFGMLGGNDDGEDPADPEERTKGARCLAMVIDIAGYGSAMVAFALMDCFFKREELIGIFKVMFSATAKGIGGAVQAITSSNNVYIAPIDGGHPILAKKSSTINNIGDNVFTNMVATDGVSLLAHGRVSNLQNHLVNPLEDDGSSLIWWQRVLAPSRLATPARRIIKGTNDMEILNNIVPGVFATVSSLSTAMACLQQAAIGKSIMVGAESSIIYDAVILYMAISSLQSWLAFFGHVAVRVPFGRDPDKEMIIKEIARVFSVRFGDSALHLSSAETKVAATAFKKKLANGDTLSEFYKGMDSMDGRDRMRQHDDFDVLIDDLKTFEIKDYKSKSALYNAMKKEVEPLLSGRGMRNFLISGFESSNFSKAVTIFDKIYKTTHPPKSIADIYNNRRQDYHTMVVMTDLIKAFAIIGLHQGGLLGSAGLFKMSLWNWGMVLAPILLTKQPYVIFNALALGLRFVAIPIIQSNWPNEITNISQTTTLYALLSKTYFGPMVTGLLVIGMGKFIYNLPLVRKFLGGGFISAGFKRAGGMIYESWRGIVEYFDWLPLEKIEVAYKYIKTVIPDWVSYFFGVGLKVGAVVFINYLANRLLVGSVAPLLDDFIGFNVLLSAMAQQDEQLFLQVLYSLIFKSALKFGSLFPFGGKEDSSEPPRLSLPPPNEPEKHAKASANTDEWTEVAAEAARSNREFEKIICDEFEKLTPGRSDELHELFDELRLAAANVASELVEYMVDGNEDRLPKSDPMQTLPVPYSRFATAVDSLLMAVSEPLPGQRLYQTSANSPAEATPEPLAEQGGAEVIRRTRQTLAQLFYEEDSEARPAPASFDVKERKTDKSERKRDKREKRRRDRGKNEAPPPRTAIAKTRAARMTHKWQNRPVFAAASLAALGMQTMAASLGIFNVIAQTVYINKDVMNPLVLHTLVKPTGDAKAQTPMESYVLASDYLKNAKTDLADGLELVQRMHTFLQGVHEQTGERGHAVFNNSLYTKFFYNHPIADENLQKLMETLTEQEISEEVLAAYDAVKTNWEAIALDFIKLVNHVTNVFEPRDEPSATGGQNSTGNNNNNTTQNIPTSKWRSWFNATDPKLGPTEVIGEVLWKSAKSVMGSVASNPEVAHAAFNFILDWWPLTFLTKKLRHKYLLRRTDMAMRDTIGIAASLGPVIMEIVLRQFFEKSWLSNSSLFYFGVVGSWNLYAALKKGHFRRHKWYDREERMYNSGTTEGMDIYQILNLQQSLPLVASLLSVRSASETTLHVVASSVFSAALLGGINYMAAFINHKLQWHSITHRIGRDEFDRGVVLRAAVSSLPLIAVALPHSLEKLLITALTAFLMNNDIGLYGRAAIPRLSAVFLTAFAVYQKGKLNGPNAFSALLYLFQSQSNQGMSPVPSLEVPGYPTSLARPTTPLNRATMSPVTPLDTPGWPTTRLTHVSEFDPALMSPTLTMDPLPGTPAFIETMKRQDRGPSRRRPRFSPSTMSPLDIVPEKASQPMSPVVPVEIPRLPTSRPTHALDRATMSPIPPLDTPGQPTTRLTHVSEFDPALMSPTLTMDPLPESPAFIETMKKPDRGPSRRRPHFSPGRMSPLNIVPEKRLLPPIPQQSSIKQDVPIPPRIPSATSTGGGTGATPRPTPEATTGGGSRPTPITSTGQQPTSSLVVPSVYKPYTFIDWLADLLWALGMR